MLWCFCKTIGQHDQRLWRLTDDTVMALCLAESLLACEGFDSKDQLSRYVRWMDSGYMSCQENCIDIGNTIHASADCLDSVELLDAVLWEFRQGADLKSLLANRFCTSHQRGVFMTEEFRAVLNHYAAGFELRIRC